MDGEDVRELVLRERCERVGPEGESKGKLALTLSNGMWYGGRGEVRVTGVPLTHEKAAFTHQ